ncbi:hypothetical protein AXF15_03825 [Desulfomicrobium orale DSM 12838]|uniref:Uncharacterized protein n=1 Tax=Desulfomicrobium orale DSM 12838 TaxID=888061 RepID=A0A0X8JP39_9BACT|nr:hypothetical protein AXF15_03825 [Desulfomicrobium orale DSM 12838]
MLELELAGISFHAGKNFGWLEADLRPENAADPVFRALRPPEAGSFYGKEDPGFLRGGYFPPVLSRRKDVMPVLRCGLRFHPKKRA